MALMHRTTIMLPTALKLGAQRRARELRVSLGDLIRSCLESAVTGGASKAPRADPFLSDREIFTGPVPRDISRRHDDHLYGDWP